MSPTRYILSKSKDFSEGWASAAGYFRAETLAVPEIMEHKVVLESGDVVTVLGGWENSLSREDYVALLKFLYDSPATIQNGAGFTYDFGTPPIWERA